MDGPRIARVDAPSDESVIAASRRRRFGGLRNIRLQYLITFAAMGAVGPYMTVFFAERGLSAPQIGVISALSSVGVMITPILITLLADTALSGRRLMMVGFAGTGLTLALLSGGGSFWSIVAWHTLFSLVFWPLLPLQDGVFFTEQHRRAERGQREVPYHVVRVWGTVGFILPSLALFFLLSRGNTTLAVLLGALIALFGLVNAIFLPGDRRGQAAREAEAKSAAPAPEPPDGAPLLPRRTGSRFPTLTAARALLEPRMLLFCGGMALVHIASAAYWPFFPLMVTERLGMDARWVGLIINVGVVVEIVFVLGFGWLAARFGTRTLMTAGAVCIGLRTLLLALWPTTEMAIATQFFHGMNAIVVNIVAPTYLNSRATPECRNSMQGLFSVAIAGTARIVGSLMGGSMARDNMLLMFGIGAGLCFLAAGLFGVAFREKRAGEKTKAQPVARDDCLVPAPLRQAS